MRIRLATYEDMEELLRIEEECFAQERFDTELLEALVTSCLLYTSPSPRD